MYSFFISFDKSEGAPSFSKFARKIGTTLEELKGFRRISEFDRAFVECNEIRRDYLIDMALNKRADASTVKFLLTTEFGMGEEDVAELARAVKKRRVSIATGVASYPMISSLAERIMKITDKVEIVPYEIKNYFFGESITVSGLLTGKDIYGQLVGKELGDSLLIPRNALRSGEDVFLCGMTVAELEEGLGVSIRVCENDGFDFIDAIFGR
jgi:NifB/MoaA-like Fe-S oxidoreductase